MIRKTQTSMNTFANATPQISVSLRVRVSFEFFVIELFTHTLTQTVKGLATPLGD
jgi:hypothetical protein